MSARRMLGVVWGVTGLVLALLALFVGRHLSAPHAMAGHEMFAAGGHPVGGTLLNGRLLTSWQLDVTAVAFVVLLAALYASAWVLARRRQPTLRWPWARPLALAGSLAAILFATCGSIAVYDQALFSAHMLGHLTLVMLAPALLAASRPLELSRAALADPTRFDAVVTGRVVAVLTSPPVAFACYTAVIVGTHLTGLMNVIMTSAWAGQLEHLAYLLVGYQFFLLVIGDEPIRWRLSLIGRVGLLGVAMAVDTFTGVVLLMSTQPVAMAAPIDTLSDTRTGGAIMWVGGDGLMAVVMALLVVAYLRAPHTGDREERSWLEQVRRSTFETNTRKPLDVERPGVDFDEDDHRREAYNEWLARLDSR